MYSGVSKFFVGGAIVFACFAAFSLPLTADAETYEERRARLARELQQIEAEIAQNQGALTEKQKERTSLERDIAILDTKIKAARLSIRQTDVNLSQIRDDISDKLSAIRELDKKVARSEDSLAQIIRRTREIDDTTLAELALGGSLSDFFTDLDSYTTLQTSLDASFDEMAALREDLSGRKRALEDKEEESEKVRQVQVLARQAIEEDEKKKQQILSVTKGQEKAYQNLIADKQRSAQQIRDELFGLRDTGAISFGTAYEYAKAAGAATGVRPAFILAILKNESDLGKNVGQCYVTDLSTGAGKGKNTGKLFSNVMKAPRDTVPYQTVTSELGIDPYTQVVSCPQSVGYGGAMGPAQFIPSTWVLYKNRLSSATGQAVPNPWNARTAFFASAMLLADNGADGGTAEAERRAALRYYAGGNWSNPAFASYGTRVMGFASEFQKDIDILEGR